MTALSTAPENLPEEIVAESYTGLASWYGEDFDGRPTASGDPFDMAALTAAHQSLPFGTRVRVTNLANGHSVVVTINDRGPYAKHRLIDLSHAAATKLGYVEDGVTKVRIDVLRDPAG
jgi:rare lipoprotein A